MIYFGIIIIVFSLVQFFLLALFYHDTNEWGVVLTSLREGSTPNYSKNTVNVAGASYVFKKPSAKAREEVAANILPNNVIQAAYEFTGTATTFPSDPVEFYRQLVLADYQGDEN
ncbi:hypothetical protein TrRE_jg11767 [Triparma retinervis]|uniref:Uncharacterized protein n=1 Tax=Triparma retinervis TaxID=2557542 RepID=A0A9W7DPI1_9STRA|nr:hypothetical protein TrRE_jg11767 [Triparma retinervis]